MRYESSVYRIWFSCFPFLKLRTRQELLDRFNGPEGVFRADVSELERVRGVSKESASLICATGLNRIETVIEECERQGITIISADDPEYPFRLKNIYSPPSALYVKGRLPEIDDAAVISVIGTRKASQYGIRMGKRLAYEISQCGGTVVSLLTAGVDHAVAEGALLAGRPCIGVLGTAHELEHSPLSEEIAENGALISEYPPGTMQIRSFFRDRNRLASGISLGTVVVEAPEKSGTRYFVNEALEQGKDIFAVPGNADSDNSLGTLDLLKMGAKPVGSGWDVLSEYAALYHDLHYSKEKLSESVPAAEVDRSVKTELVDIKTSAVPDRAAEDEWKRKTGSLNEEQAALITVIEHGASRIDEIIDSSGMPAAKVLSQMTILEIKGLITRDLSGNIKLKKQF